jgi:hypothetical protein
VRLGVTKNAAIKKMIRRKAKQSAGIQTLRGTAFREVVDFCAITFSTSRYLEILETYLLVRVSTLMRGASIQRHFDAKPQFPL